jgi:hypothetical protein
MLSISLYIAVVDVVKISVLIKRGEISLPPLGGNAISVAG